MSTFVTVIVPEPPPMPSGAILVGMLVDAYLRLTGSLAKLLGLTEY